MITFMEELAKTLLMEGRISPNTGRMMLGLIPADESKMKLHPNPLAHPDERFADGHEK